MFGKTPATPPMPEISLNKIPDDFYGGKNPVVKFKTVETVKEAKAIKPAVLSNSEKSLLDKQTTVGAGNKMHPINLLANSKFLFFAFLVIIGVVILIGGGYYFWQYRQSQKIFVPIAPVVTDIQEPEISNPVAELASTTVEQPAVNQILSLSEASLDLPSTLLGDSTNTDKDELTDVAEELFTTDPTLPDTDGDKYPDNNEIYHLYNPVGKEPMKLVDSGLISVYINPVFGYKLYYPKSWAVGNVDAGYRDVLFSTITGENIEVRVLEKKAEENFVDWFARFAPAESFADYSPIESVFKQSGFGRKDILVYFFPTDNQVFAIIYHTSNSNVVNYRMVNKLFMRSFQLGNSSELQPRIIEENPNSVSSSSPIFVSSTVSSTI